MVNDIETIVSLLEQELDTSIVKTREGQGSQKLNYLEGSKAESNANRVFSFKWSKEKLTQELIYKRDYDKTYKTKVTKMFEVAYSCTVRVSTVIDGITVFRDGTGFGNGQAKVDFPGQAYELALKESETDAMKRALKSLGKQFGLDLYDKDWDAKDAAERFNRASKADIDVSDYTDKFAAATTQKEIKAIMASYSGSYTGKINEIAALRLNSLKEQSKKKVETNDRN